MWSRITNVLRGDRLEHEIREEERLAGLAGHHEDFAPRRKPGDTSPGVALINQTFAKQFFDGENPLGKSFVKGELHYRVVGLVGDVPYREIRETFLPVAYVPFDGVDSKGGPHTIRTGTLLVRTSSSKPLALASILRREVTHARPEFRVSNIRTQQEINAAQTVSERLLAMLALFFALVAILLAGIGLYGVLDYSVLQRRREIGIRIAIGARAGDIARRVTTDVFTTVLAGAAAGPALGLVSVRYIEALLYDVEATDLGILAVPSLVIFVVALVAALPAVVRAVRIDPVAMLRAE